jgi:retron-type reverse transcriptase
MTEAQRQPVDIDGTLFHVPVGPRHCVQGAPTSPGLCNAVVLRMDHRLEGLAEKRGLAYTRYADDLAFSGNLTKEEANRLRMTIARIVEEEGFKVNPEKTRLMGKGARQRVTGVTVNQTLGLSRRERRRLRACAHQLSLQTKAAAAAPERLAWLRGKLAYLAMLNPKQAERIKL